jgi:hypothetical protein
VLDPDAGVAELRDPHVPSLEALRTHRSVP